MKRMTLISLLGLGVLVLTACASPTPAVEPTAQPQPTAMPAATLNGPAVSAPTQESTTQPPTADAATRVQITLKDNTITSSLTAFKAGVPYTFIISNSGRHEHNFNISPPVSVAGGINEALSQALLAVDETQIPPGSGTRVDFTFPASAVGSVLEFNCLIRRHYDDGMRLDITVSN